LGVLVAKGRGGRPEDPRGKPPRVLFVLDGLDEIARSDAGFAEVPFQLAQRNVVWLCAGRSDERLHEAFRAERCVHLFHGGLSGMSAKDVRAMLVDGTGALKYGLLRLDREMEQQVSNAIVDAVVAKADGLPLYVRFVVEDVQTGHLTFDAALPAKLPRGLSAYYDDMLRRFAIGERQALLTPLVVSVAWAKAPLDEETLLTLMVRRTVLDEEAGSSESLRGGLGAVAAMLRPALLPDGGFGYEPYHLTFRDHVRADEAGIIGKQNPLARKEFCKLTGDWAGLSVGSGARRYVLRHGPEHLLEEKRYEDLYRLARDREGFLAAQSRELAAEPEAPVRTLMAALRAAIAEEHGWRIAEFLLGHALRVREVLRESPLEALRGGSLERALGLVELIDAQRRALALLLLMWELQDRGMPAEVRTIRGRLVQGEVPQLRDWMAKQAGLVLGNMVGKQEGIEELCAKVIGDDGGRQAVASSLRELAESQAKAGQADAAQATFASALAAAQTISNEWARSRALGEIAESQAKAGDFSGALAAAQAIGGEGARDRALGAIAESQAKAGQTDAARATLALASAQAIGDEGARARALGAIAESQAKAGQADAARATFASALAAAQTISNEWYPAGALRELAESQAKGYRARALGEIAESQAKAGDFSGALASAQTIEDEGVRGSAAR
jgi:hypothetical protein